MTLSRLMPSIILAAALFLATASAHAAAGTNNVVTNKLSISLPTKVLPSTHHLFKPDAPPIWSGQVLHSINAGVLLRIKQSLESQTGDFALYFHDRTELFIAHAALLIVVAFLLGWMARSIRRRAET